MSLVGTRPPTLDEWEKYEPHHRANIDVSKAQFLSVYTLCYENGQI